MGSNQEKLRAAIPGIPDFLRLWFPAAVGSPLPQLVGRSVIAVKSRWGVKAMVRKWELHTGRRKAPIRALGADSRQSRMSAVTGQSNAFNP